MRMRLAKAYPKAIHHVRLKRSTDQVLAQTEGGDTLRHMAGGGLMVAVGVEWLAERVSYGGECPQVGMASVYDAPGGIWVCVLPPPGAGVVSTHAAPL